MKGYLRNGYLLVCKVTPFHEDGKNKQRHQVIGKLFYDTASKADIYRLLAGCNDPVFNDGGNA